MVGGAVRAIGNGRTHVGVPLVEHICLMARRVEPVLVDVRVTCLPIGNYLSSAICGAVAHYGAQVLVRHRIVRRLVFRLLPCPFLRTGICFQRCYARVGAVFISSSQNRSRCGGSLRGRWLSTLCRLFLLGLRIRLGLRFSFFLSFRIRLRVRFILCFCGLLSLFISLSPLRIRCCCTLLHGLPVGFQRGTELTVFTLQLLQIGARLLCNIAADFSGKRRASTHVLNA